MGKTISISEAKNNLSALLEWAVDNQEEVIVASHGRPKAVFLPYEQYEAFVAFREQDRRQAALRRLEQIAAKIQMGNEDLTAEEADQLADEITRETIQRMDDEKQVTFHRR
jgi:prevent-host-death family protein